MPGIFGYAGRENLNLKELGQNMASSMKHEDWYITDFIHDNVCVLGTVTLGDYRGTQFAQTEDKSTSVAMCGEINNKNELNGLNNNTSYSDAEFVLYLYKKKGLNFVKYLSGLFAIAVYEKNEDRLLIITDRYGSHPIFYSMNKPDVLAFASEAKVVLKALSPPLQLNKAAVADFFTFSFLLGNKTFFDGIELVPPATIMIYEGEDKNPRMQQYWDFEFKSRQCENVDIYLEEFKRLMKKAVERCVKDKEKIGIMLSGGIDSRIMTAFACQTGVEVITYTAGIKGCLDGRIARQVAHELGVENKFFEIPSDIVRNYAEDIIYRSDGMIGIRDCSFMSMLKEIRKEVDVVLVGGGADTVFGYFPKGLLESMDKNEVMEHLLTIETTLLPIQRHQYAFTEDFFKNIKGVVTADFEQTFSGVNFNSELDMAEYWKHRQRGRRLVLNTWFRYKGWDIQVRDPFWDNDFLAFRLPAELLYDKKFLQKALNYCFPSLSNIPYEKTGVPPDSSALRVFLKSAERHAKKKLKQFSGINLMPSNYVDYENWLRTKLNKKFVKDILLSDRALKRGIFKEDFIKKVVDAHMNGRENNEQLIYALMSFELMNRTFFDKE